MLPVIEAGAFDLFFIEREAERLDQMQRGAGRETGAACITGVPVDFGMNENDVIGQLLELYRPKTPLFSRGPQKRNGIMRQ